MAKEEYLYGRLLLDPRVSERLLAREDGSIGRKNADGEAEITFFIYADSPEKARELTHAIYAVELELATLREDLDQFINDFDFDRESEERGE